VIRQAISCDICTTEKRQTNHWFVAYEQSGELRVSGWNSRHRQRPDSKHLCGQTCLHKLVDEFTAKSLAVRPQHVANEDEAAAKALAVADASLTSGAAYAEPGSPRIGGSESRGPWGGEPESSARLLTPPATVPAKPVFRPQPELVTMPPWPHSQNLVPLHGERPRSVSRNWRAEAWERERERELSAIENRPDITERRRSSA
jgi:hypothetical protein